MVFKNLKLPIVILGVRKVGLSDRLKITTHKNSVLPTKNSPLDDW
ncbi:hypothetical protein VB713_05055 [Anabaena cylindrica UHCC 0172]|nr:hypothetical protein [Anabaena cylindrica]MEA5550355.1 hypothetical protein [Anabaena cylindrica UHCC 0172]